MASVSLYVDGLLQATLTQPPFNFPLNTLLFGSGSHTLTARGVDQVGNQAEASITVQVSALRVEIVYPADGATINKPAALVQGKIYNAEGEIGVVVNGVLAEVQGSDFTAIVPLQVGQNTITAIATRPDGLSGQAQITINTETQEEFVRLTATPTSGVPDQTRTLNVTFEAEAYLANPVSSYSWDFNGDGTPEITGTDATVTAQYQFPGLYFPTVTVTDTQGNSYSDITIVNVLSREEMDALLRSKWEGMRSALANQDIEKASTYYSEETKEIYNELFNALYAYLPQIAQEMQEIQLIYLKNNTAKYRMRQNELYGGRMITLTYYIYFVVDKDGMWKIYRY